MITRPRLMAVFVLRLILFTVCITCCCQTVRAQVCSRFLGQRLRGTVNAVGDATGSDPSIGSYSLHEVITDPVSVTPLSFSSSSQMIDLAAGHANIEFHNQFSIQVLNADGTLGTDTIKEVMFGTGNGADPFDPSVLSFRLTPDCNYHFAVSFTLSGKVPAQVGADGVTLTVTHTNPPSTMTGNPTQIIFPDSSNLAFALPSSGFVLSGSTTVMLPSLVNVDTSDGTNLATIPTKWTITWNFSPSDLAISTQSLPSGTVGVAYPLTALVATGGTPPYRWSATGLPAGLAADPTTGMISGTPTAGGNLTVVAQVTDSAGATASKSLSLTVNQPAYSIVISGAEGVTGAPFIAVPSVIACGKSPNSQSPVMIQAVFLNLKTNAQVTGGSLNLSLAEKVDSGGHPHSGRPLGTLDSQSGESPLSTVYTPGEASGEIDLTVTGTAPDGSTPAPAHAAINIQSPGSPFTILSGVTFSIKSHPQGTYGTAQMETAVADMASSYLFYAHQLGDLNPSPVLSEAASLPLGGVFDITLMWKQPHCGHRDGQTIDLSLSNKTGRERIALSVAAHDAGLGFYYLPESPDSPTTNHWHATLTH